MRQHRNAVKGRKGPAMPAGLSLVRQDRKAISWRETAHEGGIEGAAPTAFTVRVDADRWTRPFHSRI